MIVSKIELEAPTLASLKPVNKFASSLLEIL